MSRPPAPAPDRAPPDHEPEAATWARNKVGLTKRVLSRTIGISEQLRKEGESGRRNATPANLRKFAERRSRAGRLTEHGFQP